MSYLTIARGVIVRHKSKKEGGGARTDVEQELPTISLRCVECGWSTKGIDPQSTEAQPLEKPRQCICGGTLMPMKKPARVK